MASEKEKMRYPDGNPKTQYGVKKPPLWYVPFVAIYRTALAHLHGHLKYGHFNWREDPVSISTYLDAACRHLIAYKEGQQDALDSKCHHLAHACACLNIIMDAEFHGTLIDDRHEQSTDYDMLFEELGETLQHLHSEFGDFRKNSTETEGTKE